MPDSKTCLNCSNVVENEYCSYCGQRTSIGRISFREVGKNFLSSAFAIEGPFWKTVLGLILRPKVLFNEYLGGKRKTYYKAVQFFLVMTAVYLILKSLLGYDSLEGTTAEVRAGDSSEMHITKQAARFMTDNINNILFVLVFSFATMMKLFFRKRFNLAEYSAVGFYLVGIYILFGTLIMIFAVLTGIRLHNIQFAFLFGLL